jgi:dTDP-4-dehydrorhamnose 3,5-epimerase
MIDTGIPGLIVVEPKIFGDERGYFLETWSKQRYEEAGIPGDFCQDNMSYSRKGILRGLHMQNPNAQGKLVSVVQGEVLDVAVDLRRGSPTFKKWYGIILSEEKKNQMFVPKGFAHGFCVLSATAIFTYKCTDFYNPKAEICLRWDDPDIGIKWPVTAPELSARDAAGVRLKDVPESSFLAYGGN